MYIMISSLAFATLAFAPLERWQRLLEVPLFPSGKVPGEVPGAVGPESTENFTTQNGYVAVQTRNVSVPTITPFLVAPADCPKGGCPAVVVAPGGAYKLLSMSLEGWDVAERFVAMGVSAFVLKYRVPQRPAQPGVKGRETFGWAPLQDAQRAMGLVRQRAVEWRVDPTKVGFNGFSAGGHLTVHLATSWGERKYPRVDAADELPCRLVPKAWPVWPSGFHGRGWPEPGAALDLIFPLMRGLLEPHPLC